MRYLILPLFTMGLLITSGCRYKPQEQFEGTWVHTIPWTNGRERTLILRGIRDNEGNLVFKFLKQYYSHKPVFTECSVEKDGIEIHFKLATYYGGSESEHRLKYVLRRTKQVLHGQLFQSWTGPVEVILRRLNQEDATKVLEALAEELDSKKAKLAETYTKCEKAKKQLKGNFEKLEMQLSKSQREAKKLTEHLLASEHKIEELETKLTAAKENIREQEKQGEEEAPRI